jgi:hypothetical protein
MPSWLSAAATTSVLLLLLLVVVVVVLLLLLPHKLSRQPSLTWTLSTLSGVAAGEATFINSASPPSKVLTM